MNVQSDDVRNTWCEGSSDKQTDLAHFYTIPSQTKKIIPVIYFLIKKFIKKKYHVDGCFLNSLLTLDKSKYLLCGLLTGQKSVFSLYKAPLGALNGMLRQPLLFYLLVA